MSTISLFLLFLTTTTTAAAAPSNLLQDTLSRTLHEVLEGPLGGLEVTLLLQKDILASFNLDILLREAGKDVSLMSYEEEEKEMRGAVVAMVQDVPPWALHLPSSSSWSPSALLLLKVAEEGGDGCEAARLLEAPLAQRTPALALVCLEERQEEEEEEEEIAKTNESGNGEKMTFAQERNEAKELETEKKEVSKTEEQEGEKSEFAHERSTRGHEAISKTKEEREQEKRERKNRKPIEEIDKEDMEKGESTERKGMQQQRTRKRQGITTQELKDHKEEGEETVTAKSKQQRMSPVEKIENVNEFEYNAKNDSQKVEKERLEIKSNKSQQETTGPVKNKENLNRLEYNAKNESQKMEIDESQGVKRTKNQETMQTKEENMNRNENNTKNDSQSMENDSKTTQSQLKPTRTVINKENVNSTQHITKIKTSVQARVMTWLPYTSNGPSLLSLGSWDKQTFRTFHSLFPERFKTLGGTVLDVASDMDDAPLVFRDDNDEFDGTSKRLLDAVALKMNFTYTLTDRAPDNKWGELENGTTWVGLLGEVYRGNKHIAINYFTITEERADFFDHSVSYLTEGFGFALPIPPEVPKWTKLVYPFTWDMWAAVGGVTIGATAALLVLSTLQPRPHASRPSPTTLAPALACVMKGLVSQAQGKVPGGWSIRVFLGGWWVAAFIMDIAYTGCLIAVLTVPSYPARIHTLAHLALSHHRLCMLDYGEFVPDALLASEDDVMRTLGERMDLSPTTDIGFYGQEKCAERVMAGTSAHVETYAYLKITYVDMGLGDRVYIMREQVYEGNLAFFFRKHTPWIEGVNSVMRAMMEGGFVNKWQTEILEGLGMTGRQDEAGSRPQPLGLAHLQGAFLLYGIGFGTALGAFLFECRRRKEDEGLGGTRG